MAWLTTALMTLPIKNSVVSNSNDTMSKNKEVCLVVLRIKWVSVKKNLIFHPFSMLLPSMFSTNLIFASRMKQLFQDIAFYPPFSGTLTHTIPGKLKSTHIYISSSIYPLYQVV